MLISNCNLKLPLIGLGHTFHSTACIHTCMHARTFYSSSGWGADESFLRSRYLNHTVTLRACMHATR